MEPSFILNERFEIDTIRGVVHDREAGKSARIEPRLMKLLCLLAFNRGTLVSRERITKEVWDDYGNADEGLTQGISYLRKVLGDEQKKLIETVPKKGYILHATIEEPGKIQTVNVAETMPSPTRPKKRSTWRIGITVLVCILSLYFLIRQIGKSKEKEPIHMSPDVLQNRNGDSTEQRVPTGSVIIHDSLPNNTNSSDLKP